MRTDLLRFNGAVERDPAIDAWMKEHAGELAAIAHQWFEVMRKCGDEVRELLHAGCPVARHRQVHASCEAETGNGHKRRSAKQAHRHGVLRYKGARRKRLATYCCCVSLRSSLRPQPRTARGPTARPCVASGRQ